MLPIPELVRETCTVRVGESLEIFGAGRWMMTCARLRMREFEPAMAPLGSVEVLLQVFLVVEADAAFFAFVIPFE